MRAGRCSVDQGETPDEKWRKFAKNQFVKRSKKTNVHDVRETDYRM